MEQIKEVHRSHRRLHVEDKLSGRAAYGADLRRSDLMYAKGVSPGCAAGRIEEIDVSACLAVPGVAAVYTARDLPGHNGFGLFTDDEPILARDEVKFAGDVAALVVAESRQAAEEGGRRIRFSIAPVKPLLSVEEALASPRRIHPGYAGNICADKRVVKGSAAAALERADVVVEETYHTSWVEHAYLEPEVMSVLPMEGGRLEIRGAMQHPFYMRQVVCEALALPESQVVVHPDVLGGSFGGKVEISGAMAARAALAALRLGRPVLYVLSREESVAQSHKRHGIRFHVRLGASREGTLEALEVRALMDAGAYVNESPIVSWKTVTCGPGPYVLPHVSYRNTAVLTNNMVCGAMRGFGTPQAIFAMESAMNELAQRLGMSPTELRRKNFLHEGDATATSHVLRDHAVSIAGVMERAARALGFDEKFARYSRIQEGPLRRGVGVACSIRGVSFGADSEDTGRARIVPQADGTVEFMCPMMEMGQGAETVLSQICADALGLPLERVRRLQPETDRSPDTGAAGASRGTFIGGNAILQAAAALKGQIAACLGAEPVDFSQGQVLVGDRKLSWEELYRELCARGKTPDAAAAYTVPLMPWDEEHCQGDAFISYTYSCHAAEVEVDTQTGQVRVLRMTACHDAGRIVNPQMAAGQVYGGMAMGLGMALMEEVEADPRSGVIRTDNYDTYLLPTALDACPFCVEFLEHPDASSPFGAKSLGEPAMEPAPAAILGAVNHALGSAGAVRRMPADLETVFFAAHPEWRGEKE